MRYLIPPLAIVLVAVTLPSDPIALVAYLAIASYSAFVVTSLVLDASPKVQRQSRIAIGIVLGVALGIGLYHRFH